MAIQENTPSRRTFLAGLAAAPVALAAPAIAAGQDHTIRDMVIQWEEMHRFRTELLTTGRDDEADVLCDAEFDMLERILNWPVRSAADVATKARLLAVGQDEPRVDVDDLARESFDREGYSEGAIALRIVSDLQRFAGQAGT